jgi:hypothetical protein
MNAPYWLRIAEENSSTIRSRSHALVEKLRSSVKTDDIAALEHRVAIAVQENKLLRNKRPAEFMNPSADSATKGIARTFSSGRKPEWRPKLAPTINSFGSGY